MLQIGRVPVWNIVPASNNEIIAKKFKGLQKYFESRHYEKYSAGFDYKTDYQYFEDGQQKLLDKMENQKENDIEYIQGDGFDELDKVVS